MYATRNSQLDSSGTAGLTLIEVLIALLLFTASATFGLSLLRQNKLLLHRIAEHRKQLELETLNQAATRASQKSLLALGGTDSGTGITELLVVLLCVSILFGLSHAHIRSSFILQQRLSESIASQEILNGLRQDIYLGLKGTHVRYAIDAVRIQPPGILLDAFGSPLSVSSGEARRQPAATSTALTFLHLDPDWLLYPRQFSSDEFCSNGTITPKQSIASFSNWLAIYADGFLQVQGTLTQNHRSNRCPGGKSYRGHLQANRTALFHQQPEQPQLLALLPIADCYSLYLDSSNTFRRFSHQTHENQPVATEITEILHGIELETQPRVLRTQILYKGRQFEFRNSIGFQPRIDILDAVL